MDNQEIQSGMKPRSIIQALLLFQEFLTQMKMTFVDILNYNNQRVMDTQTDIKSLREEVKRQFKDFNEAQVGFDHDIDDVYTAIAELRGDIGSIHSAIKTLNQDININNYGRKKNKRKTRS